MDPLLIIALVVAVVAAAGFVFLRRRDPALPGSVDLSLPPSMGPEPQEEEPAPAPTPQSPPKSVPIHTPRPKKMGSKNRRMARQERTVDMIDRPLDDCIQSEGPGDS